jgi:hypothetical protein
MVNDHVTGGIIDGIIDNIIIDDTEWTKAFIESPELMLLTFEALHRKDLIAILEGTILENLRFVIMYMHDNATQKQIADALAPLQKRIEAFATILITELTEMEIKINGRKQKLILSDDKIDRRHRDKSKHDRSATSQTNRAEEESDRTRISLSSYNAEV